MRGGNLWSESATTQAPVYPRLDRAIETQIAVIGGGFTGLSTALHLAEAGQKVALVEAQDVGFGASGRNGGQVNPGLKLGQQELIERFGEAGRRFFRLGEEAVDFLAALIDRKRLRCSFIRPGVVTLAHRTPALGWLRERHRALNESGTPARLLSPAEVAEKVGTHRYVGGLFDPRGGSVHPLDLSRELARVAAEARVQIFTHSPALSLASVGDRWRISSAEGGAVADEVVVATNAYSDRLVPGLARSLLPVNSFQLATEPLGPELDRQVLPERNAVYDSRRLILYFRKSPDGRIILGGRASFRSAEPARQRTRDYDVLRSVLADIFPQLRRVPISHRWTGLVGITRDFLPHYHQPAHGLHVLVGYNGRGVALSNRAGAWLAAAICGRADEAGIPATTIQPIPLHAFRAPVSNVIMIWQRALDYFGY